MKRSFSDKMSCFHRGRLATSFENGKASCSSVLDGWDLLSASEDCVSFSLDEGWGSISLNLDDTGFVQMEWTESDVRRSITVDIKEVVQDFVAKIAEIVYDRPTKDIELSLNSILKVAGILKFTYLSKPILVFN